MNKLELEIAVKNGADLRGADLRGADLNWADLRGAGLRGADLRGASLGGADLRGADLGGANFNWADLVGATLTNCILPTGETFEDYINLVVPELLKAGGKSIKEIIATGCWKCNSWNNCPMHEAFDVCSFLDTPILLRPRIEQFIQLFDAGLIPCPKIEE